MANHYQKPRISPARGGGKAGSSNKGGGKGRGNSPSNQRPEGGRLSRIARKFWVLAFSLFFTATIVVMGVIAYFASDLPDISKLQNFDKNPGIRVYAANGRMIASYGQVVGEPLTYHEFPKELIAALVATEDRRFFDHFGIDVLGLLRASIRNMIAGGIVQGGSTITQQLAKNVFLTMDRTFARKFQEVILAVWLENHFTKKQILELYLNRVYLGAGNYGVDAAARHYFNKSARKLNLQESALLIGLLKAPSHYSPTRDPELAKKRTKQVLINMEDAGFINEKEVSLAISHMPRELQMPRTDIGSYRYFADWITDQIPEYVGRVDGDMEVLTTFDPSLQQRAQQALYREMTNRGEALNASQAALISMQPDGAIRALIGGVDYHKSQFNRATQATRQPGSAFKLLVYLAALEAGYHPDTMVNDRPITIGKWSPKNYTNDYRGEIRLREAFFRSINTVAAQITAQIGSRRVVRMAQRLGIHSKLLATPALSLGTNDVTLLEMTTAFAHVANEGKGVIPYAIKEIRTKSGTLLYRHRAGSKRQVLPVSVVHQMNDMLMNVVQWGTARKAQIGRPVAGKTGTTQDYRDAWFLGFTPQLVTGVWVGNDNYSPMKKVTGGTLPTEIWASFMRTALAKSPILEIPKNAVYDGGASSLAAESDGYPLSSSSSGGSDSETPSTASPAAIPPSPSEGAATMPATAAAATSTDTPPPAPAAAPEMQETLPAQPKDVFEWYEKEHDPAPSTKPQKPAAAAPPSPAAPVEKMIDTLYETLKKGEQNGKIDYSYPDRRR
jgi:penicillin-binding protein 1A